MVTTFNIDITVICLITLHAGDDRPMELLNKTVHGLNLALGREAVVE